jgi:hypothetical protein
MNILKTFEDGSALAELTPTEASLIQKALTAPIKRKVKLMTVKLQELEDSICVAKEFNEQFIKTFYTPKNGRNK